MPVDKVPDLPKTARERTVFRDRCCRVTQASCGTEQAHLIPVAASDWFTLNGMGQYSVDSSVFPEIDDLSNTVLLRSDVHTMLDHKELTIVPKLDEEAKYKLVTHVMHSQSRYAAEQENLFHNRIMQQLCDISPSCLFARFAWSLFHKETLRLFETRRASFQVRIRTSLKPGQPPNVTTEAIRELAQLPSISEKKSTSKKRSISRSAGQDCDDEYWDVGQERIVHRDDDDFGLDSELHNVSDDESDSDRGRKRNRSTSPGSSTPPLSRSVASIISSGICDSGPASKGKDKTFSHIHDVTIKQAIPLKHSGDKPKYT
ncbi:hypothetical protein Hte_005884 [Hypoxylon texense]